jgi:hypothetical protein
MDSDLEDGSRWRLWAPWRHVRAKAMVKALLATPTFN